MRRQFRLGWALLFVVVAVGCRDTSLPLPTPNDNGVCCAQPPERPRPEVVIELVSVTSDQDEFVVRGVDATVIASLKQRGEDALESSFEVRVGPGDDLPPMVGEHAVVDDTIVFRPGFPITAGLTYHARWSPVFAGPSARPVTTTFEIPSVERAPTTHVTDVFPSGEVVPENLLRFYVNFSAPMSRGFAYDCVELHDEETGVVEDAFLELQEELWNPEGTRFTLLFDPGRVKRDLVPNREVGTPLREGHRYELVVKTTWQDAEGQPLRAEFRKHFRVVDPDTTSPVPTDWVLAIPKAGPRTPLRIDFDEALDHALALRTIRVVDADGDDVPGEPLVLNGETSWEFDVETPWQPGSYAIEVEPILEDVAGNSVGRPFEVELTKPTPETPTEPVRLPFVVERPAD